MASNGSRGRTVLLNLALLVAYVLLGRAGLFLAVPPGYATAIFPPAGIAVGAMYVFGTRALPAIVLGSFLLNLWIGAGGPVHGMAVAAASAAVIATASGLQAAIGGTALRRFIGNPAALDNVGDIARFVLLAPLICLVSVSFSLSALWLMGTVKAADLATSFMAWWIGDTLGVLIALPLLLTLVGEPRLLWRRRTRTLAIPMLLFFALFVATFVRVSAWEQGQSLSEFRLDSQKLNDDLKSRFDELAIVLDQLKAGFASRRTAISDRNFAALASVLLARFPMVQAVEWAPQMGSKGGAVKDELAGIVVRERDPAGGMRPVRPRPEYFPVAYVEPLGGNEAALGFDLASDAARRTAIRQAFASKRVAATAPIHLVQAHADRSGLLIVEAVTSGPSSPGVLLIVLRMSRFVESAVAVLAPDVDVRVTDMAAAVPLFDTFNGAPRTLSKRSFAFGGRRYLLATAPTPAYLVRHRGWQSWSILVGGIFCTGLLGAFLMLGTGQSWRFESLLEERTRDLKHSHDALKHEIAEREQAQAALAEAQRMQAIGQLTGGIAHDFNNLLMVVTGSVDLMRRQLEGHPAEKYLEMLRAAAYRGQRLTRQLLSFARQKALNPRVIDLSAATRSAADMIRLSLRGDIDVRTDIPDRVCAVKLDAAEYELALLNLAVNARDAMSEGGVLSLNVTETAEANGVEGRCFAVRISDNGKGISPELLSRVFEPYFTTKATGTGTGLGLSQVYGFAKQSSGSVTIESTPGHGTTVILLVPASDESPAPSSAARTDGALLRGRLARALIVEDDAEVAKVLAAQVNALGYDVETANGGKAALERIAREPALDIVISDVLMPGGMSGIELARRLRNEARSLPVLLVTGYSGSEDRTAGEAFAVLRKPFEIEALAQAITDLLGRTKEVAG